MVTRAELREAANRGPSSEELRQTRFTRLALAAEDAFGAATLLAAQQALGAALPEQVTSIGLSAPFDSPTGASPQATITATLTVPAGNPGYIAMNATNASGTYRTVKNGTPNVGISALQLFANGDTLQFDVTSSGSGVTVALTDATTGAVLCPTFTITTT